MGKWTDKLYITHGEWATDFGGAKAASKRSTEVHHLPFGCCNRSFAQLLGKGAAPGVQPVLDTNTGLLYDRHAISKGDLDPLTSSLNSVIDGSSASSPKKPHITENSAKKDDSRFISIQWESDPMTGETICPVSRRVLTDNLPIVAIRTSGWLYDAETIQQLNISRRNFTDLVTGVPFISTDIIPLATRATSAASQQPRDMRMFEQKRSQMTTSPSGDIAASNPSPSIDRIVRSIREKPSALQTECRRLGLEKMQLRHLPSNTIISCPGAAPMPPRSVYAPPLSTKGTKGVVAASLTSTAMSIATRNEELASKSGPPAAKRVRH